MVLLLGPRQAGKTTLAQRHRLVILDEVQRLPDLFAVLRDGIEVMNPLGAAARVAGA